MKIEKEQTSTRTIFSAGKDVKQECLNRAGCKRALQFTFIPGSESINMEIKSFMWIMSLT